MAAKWRFYVYELLLPDGGIAYVGKGSSNRLSVQKRKFGLDGMEVARFKRERDAYSFERQRIKESLPKLNRHPGGNGSRVTPIRKEREMQLRTPSRQEIARFLLARFPSRLSEVDAIRRVAFG